MVTGLFSAIALSILLAFSLFMILSNMLPNVDNVFVMTIVISLQLPVLTSLPYAQNPKTN
ncbi:MAG: hypothetical protein BAA02_04270 [Paenibacillaceae bacterium ZCTH02-B3]|nr:MAG: hypothetical protein BAA02_04270 [Paenibacillaceae bacterium ZCTH02-B3]